MPVIFGETMTHDQVIAQLGNPENLENMAWALRDWSELIHWLATFDVPETHGEDEVWYSAREKVEWLVENVEHGRIIGS